MLLFYLTTGKIELPNKSKPTLASIFNGRICPFGIEITHGAIDLLLIYTWPGP